MNTNKFYIFVAEWCPYCRASKSAIFELMDKYAVNNNIILVDDTSEEYKTVGIKLGATMLPSFIIANENDEEVARFDGDRTFANLLDFYAQHTGTPIIQDGLNS
jgi:thiol-disulfide isomerase/thioredoxin